MDAPTPIEVTMTYSANNTWSKATQAYTIPNIQGYDGSVPVATSSDPTIVTDDSEYAYSNTFQVFNGGLLTCQGKAGTAQVTITIDGVVNAILDVTVTENALESGGPVVLGQYTPPAPPAP